MKFKVISNENKTEKILEMVADTQAFADKNDKLNQLIDKYSSYFGDELSEDELNYAAAAVKPDVPKYKKINKLP